MKTAIHAAVQPVRNAVAQTLEMLEERRLYSTYVVSNTADSGAGSLRQAMLDANSHGGLDSIHFNIGSGTKTITPLSALPFINSSLIIDGTTQPGYAGKPIIELNGAPTINASGFTIQLGGGTTIKGMVINRFANYGIQDVSSGNNTIQNNYIGTNVAGNADLGNGKGGISLFSDSNLIGGTTAAHRNVISGNGTNSNFIGNGIMTNNAGGGNVIKGNYIGVAADGTTPLGNAASGVYLSDGNGTVQNNIIAYNGSAGVHVGPSFFSNKITANSIYGNKGIGIDLRNPTTALPDGLTPNDELDVDEGSNHLQNAPVLTSVVTDGGVTTVTGTIRSEANKTYRIELFLNGLADAAPQAKTFLEAVNVTTNASGKGEFTLNLSAASKLGYITATATDPSNNTSEISAPALITIPPVRGTVFKDVNEDAQQNNNEPGLAGCTVFIDRNNNGVLDRREKRVVTGTDGSYRFKGLVAETQRVRIVPVVGYRQTIPGTVGHDIQPTGATVIGRYNFGLTSRGLLRGTVFNDANENGVRDNGETGLAGATVFIDANDNGSLDAGEQSRVVGATGAYRFNRLLRGRYILRAIAPDGYTQTAPAQDFISAKLNRGSYLGNRNFGLES